jgi:hypothetical protein
MKECDFMDGVYNALRQAFIERAYKLGINAVEHETPEQPIEFYREKVYLFSMVPDFAFHFKERTEEMDTLLSVMNKMKPAYDLYGDAAYLPFDSVKDFKCLCEMGNYVLAAKLLANNELHFVTWMYDYQRCGVLWGHYFGYDFEGAKQDFAVRAGLTDENKIFKDKELEVLHEACLDKLLDDKNLDYDREKSLQALIHKIEKIEPKFSEQSQEIEIVKETNISQEV